MQRQYLTITVVQDEDGFKVKVGETARHDPYNARTLPSLAHGDNLDVDAAASTVAAALEQWGAYEVKMGWRE
jgi:hypothetical protein